MSQRSREKFFLLKKLFTNFFKKNHKCVQGSFSQSCDVFSQYWLNTSKKQIYFLNRSGLLLFEGHTTQCNGDQLEGQLKQRGKQCFGDELNQGIMDKPSGCDVPWTTSRSPGKEIFTETFHRFPQSSSSKSSQIFTLPLHVCAAEYK